MPSLINAAPEIKNPVAMLHKPPSKLENKKVKNNFRDSGSRLFEVGIGVMDVITVVKRMEQTVTVKEKEKADQMD